MLSVSVVESWGYWSFKKDATSAAVEALAAKIVPSSVSILKDCVNRHKPHNNSYTHPKITGTLTNRPSSNILYGKSAMRSPSIAGVNGNSESPVRPG